MEKKEKIKNRGCFGFTPAMEGHLSDREAGFSLIEVLIAMLIVTIGLLAVGTMQVSALGGCASALSQSEAVGWGQAVVDEVLARPFDSDYLRSGTHPMADDPADIVPVTGARARGYTINWDVANDSPVPQAKSVTATVSWQSKGLNRRVVLVSVRPQF